MAHVWRSRVAWRIRWLSALNVVALYALLGTMTLVEEWSRHFFLPWIFLVALGLVIVLPFCIIAMLIGKHRAAFAGWERSAAMDECLLAVPQRPVAVFASWVLAAAAPWLSALLIHLPILPALVMLSIVTFNEGFACAAWLGALVLHFTTLSMLVGRVLPMTSRSTGSAERRGSVIQEFLKSLRGIDIEVEREGSKLFGGLFLILPLFLPLIGVFMGYPWVQAFLSAAGLVLMQDAWALSQASRLLARGYETPPPAATSSKPAGRRVRSGFARARRGWLFNNHPLAWQGFRRAWGRFGPLRAMTVGGQGADFGLRILPLDPFDVVASELILLLLRTLTIVVPGVLVGLVATLAVTEKLLFLEYWGMGLIWLPFFPLAGLAMEMFRLTSGYWKIRVGLFAVLLAGIASGVWLSNTWLGAGDFAAGIVFIQLEIMAGLVLLMFLLLGAEASEALPVTSGLSLEDIAPIGKTPRARPGVGFTGWMLRGGGVILILLMMASAIQQWRLGRKIEAAEAEWRKRGWPPTPEELYRWRPVPPDDENAALAFRRAVRCMVHVPLPGQLTGREWGTVEPYPPATNDYLKVCATLIGSNRQAIALAMAASRLSRTRVSGTDPGTWQDTYRVARQDAEMAELLRHVAMAQMAAGSRKEALDAMNALFAFARSSGKDPSNHWGWVYSQRINSSSSNAALLLSTYGLTMGELERLRLMVEACDPDDGLEDTMLGDLVFRRELIGWFPHILAGMWRTGPTMWKFGRRLATVGDCCGLAWDHVTGAALRWELALLEAGPALHEVLKRERALWKAGVASVEIELSDGGPRHGTVLGYLRMSWLAANTRRNALLTAIAIEKFRLREGRRPEKLEDLVPADLAEVPRDPADGQPLRYRTPAFGYAVYGLGENGRDDGGVEDCYSGHPSGNPDIAVKIER